MLLAPRPHVSRRHRTAPTGTLPCDYFYQTVCHVQPRKRLREPSRRSRKRKADSEGTLAKRRGGVGANRIGEVLRPDIDVSITGRHDSAAGSVKRSTAADNGGAASTDGGRDLRLEAETAMLEQRTVGQPQGSRTVPCSARGGRTCWYTEPPLPLQALMKLPL